MFDGYAPVVKGVFDPGGGFGAVGDGDHHRRGGMVGFPPGAAGGGPVVSEQGVPGYHQVGQRDRRFRPLVEVGFYFVVVVDVIEAGFVGVGVVAGVVPYHHAGGFD